MGHQNFSRPCEWASLKKGKGAEPFAEARRFQEMRAAEIFGLWANVRCTPRNRRLN
jgi:hypothetical protein